MSRTAAMLLALALLVATASARAQDPQPMEPCERDARAMATALDIDARRTRVWYWAWMATGTALLAGQGALASLAHGDERIEFATGAATSLFIPALLILHPPNVMGDARLLDARLDASTVDRRLGDPCIARERAREIFARDAADEALATGWIAHSFVIGGNIAVGLLLALAFHDGWGGAKQAFGGSVVGELQILTLPAGALKARGLGFEGSF